MLAPKPLLQCLALCKSFGALQVVRNISFTVTSGEIMGIVGPNGAGKTSLFNLISGHTRCDAGSIRLGDIDITQMTPEQRFHHGIARTFQIPEAFSSQTVFDNALVGATFGSGARRVPIMFSGPTWATATEALEAVGLSSQRKQRAGTLTPFDKKRLMIATAFAARPIILLLDEPFGGLSEEEIDKTIEIVLALNARGATVVIVEHVLRALFKLTKRLFVMKEGEKIFEGSPEDFIGDERVIASYLGTRYASRAKVM